MFSKEAFLEGKLLLIDKPLHWTSFQAVHKIRWLIRNQFQLKKIKVGHAGTLDPLASGLLLICTGKFTKKIQELQGQEKEYEGTFRLGATTPSYDLETEINAVFQTDHITKKNIDDVAGSFVGDIQQKPPIFSALKKDGKRLYEYARAEENIDIPSRTVSIRTLEIRRIEMPDIAVKVCCSKGTYIRSLAHDFGKALGSGAHLTALRRTRIGSYDIKNAMTLEDFEKSLKSDSY